MRAQQLSSRISLFLPNSPESGQLVILCSWADAQPKHILRYIQLHQAITPNASILLIQTPAAALFAPYRWQRAALKPAVEYIKSRLADIQGGTSSATVDPNETNTDNSKEERSQTTTTKKIKILIHVLSTGGGLTTTQLLILFRQSTHAPLPLIGIIMDSSPDGGSYKQSYRAMVGAQPPSIPRRAAVSLVAHAALLPFWATYAVGIRENSQLELRRVILDRKFVDATHICYVYSKNDRITDWRDVLVHAADARGCGWSVEEHLLENSSHCAHVRSNPDMYAAIVKQFWERAKLQSKL